MTRLKDDIRSSCFWRGVACECLGSLVLILIGCGACVETDFTEHPYTVKVALAFGLAYTAILFCVRYSEDEEGHINPAVTVALLATRRTSVVRAVLYLAAQMLGAILGAGIVYVVTADDHRGGRFGCTVLAAKVADGQGFVVEFLATFFFVFVVFATYDVRHQNEAMTIPFVIGLSFTGVYLLTVPFTGGSVNTARSFGPAVVNNIWTSHWVFWFGPLLGGIVGGVCYDLLFSQSASFTRLRTCLFVFHEKDENPKLLTDRTSSSHETSKGLLLVNKVKKKTLTTVCHLESSDEIFDQVQAANSKHRNHRFKSGKPVIDTVEIPEGSSQKIQTLSKQSSLQELTDGDTGGKIVMKRSESSPAKMASLACTTNQCQELDKRPHCGIEDPEGCSQSISNKSDEQKDFPANGLVESRFQSNALREVEAEITDPSLKWNNNKNNRLSGSTTDETPQDFQPTTTCPEPTSNKETASTETSTPSKKPYEDYFSEIVDDPEEPYWKLSVDSVKNRRRHRSKSQMSETPAGKTSTNGKLIKDPNSVKYDLQGRTSEKEKHQKFGDSLGQPGNLKVDQPSSIQRNGVEIEPDQDDVTKKRNSTIETERRTPKVSFSIDTFMKNSNTIPKISKAQQTQFMHMIDPENPLYEKDDHTVIRKNFLQQTYLEVTNSASKVMSQQSPPEIKKSVSAEKLSPKDTTAVRESQRSPAFEKETLPATDNPIPAKRSHSKSSAKVTLPSSIPISQPVENLEAGDKTIATLEVTQLNSVDEISRGISPEDASQVQNLPIESPASVQIVDETRSSYGIQEEKIGLDLAELESEKDLKSEEKSNSVMDVKPETEVMLEAELTHEIDLKSETELEIETGMRPEAESKSETDLKPEIESKSESELRPEIDSKLVTELKPEVESKPVTELKSESELEPEIESKSITEPKQEIESTDLKSEDEFKATTELKSATHSESETGSKPESILKLETEPDSKTELPPEPPKVVPNVQTDPEKKPDYRQWKSFEISGSKPTEKLGRRGKSVESNSSSSVSFTEIQHAKNT